MHRVASSGRYHSPLHEIETLWSFDDVLAANVVLDLYEESERRAARRMQDETKGSKR